MANYKTSFTVNSYTLNSGYKTSQKFPLQEFRGLSLQFILYFNGQLAQDWHSLMVRVHNDGSFNNELFHLWIYDCKFTINGSQQILLPNIKYDQINTTDFGWVKFLERKKLNGMLGKTLTVDYIFLGYVIELEFNVIIGNTNHLNILAQMFEDREFADVTFNVKGIELTAYKCVLAKRSPVFQRMFNTEMIEQKTNTVNIVDMEQHVFEQFLKYIYTGNASIKDYVAELYFAADMYQMVDLK